MSGVISSSCSVLPGVMGVSERELEFGPLFTTLAVTPMPSALMASRTPFRLLVAGVSVMALAVLPYTSCNVRAPATDTLVAAGSANVAIEVDGVGEACSVLVNRFTGAAE